MIETLLKVPNYGIFWQMRVGKTKPVIDAFCIDCVISKVKPNMIVVCPAQVKEVWTDPHLGEIVKHSFLPQSFGKQQAVVPYESEAAEGLTEIFGEGEEPFFVVASYEYLRQTDAQGKYFLAKKLLASMGTRPYWLVFDESSALANWKSEQYRACEVLRKKSAHCIELDGTPTETGKMSQYAKFKMLDPAILGYQSYFHFRAVHCELTTDVQPVLKNGKRKMMKVQKIGKFRRQEVIDKKVRPFCEVLTQADVGLQLPPFINSFLPFHLARKTWKLYEGMRDDMVAELENGVCAPEHAAVKVLRLAQICSGFLGGVEDEGGLYPRVEKVGTESADMVGQWLKTRLMEDPEFKVVIWARFRKELETLALIAETLAGSSNMGVSMGGCKSYDNQLHGDAPLHKGQFVLVAQPQSLKYGTNLSQAGTEIYTSQDYSLVTRSQSEQRLQAPNGRKNTYVLDCLAYGPNGERTITHDIHQMLSESRSVATRTAAEWKKALMGERI